jgi:hypothetical protein
MLPAICFVFQQELCEKIVTALVQKLEKAEPEPESKKSKRVRDPTKPMFKEVVDKEEKETGEEGTHPTPSHLPSLLTFGLVVWSKGGLPLPLMKQVIIDSGSNVPIFS